MGSSDLALKMSLSWDGEGGGIDQKNYLFIYLFFLGGGGGELLSLDETLQVL